MLSAKITYKNIWLIAYPIILGSVTQNVINFTDTAFLGRVSEIALGAGALGGLLYLAIFMLGLGFGTGAQIIIARRIGEQNQKKVGAVVDHSLIFMFFLALLAFSFMYFVSPGLLKHAITSDEVYQETVSFISYRAFGIFFAFMNVVFRAFYVGRADTKVITYSMLVMAFVNVSLDYMLIFGKAGMPEMGIKGAALASTIAEAFTLFSFAIYTFLKIDFNNFAIFRFEKLSLAKMFDIFKLSFPIMMQQFASLSVWFVFFLIIEKLGEASLAVSNIIRSIYVILMIPVWGFSAATNTLVSSMIGAGRNEEVIKVVYKIVVLTFSGVLAIVLSGLLFPDIIMKIYTNDSLLIQLGKQILPIVSIGALLISIGFILFNGVSGTGKTSVSLLIEIVVLSIYLLYSFVMVSYLKAGVIEVWTSELVYGSLLALFSWSYLKWGKWRNIVI
jgi:putative MATE family efflux protein